MRTSDVDSQLTYVDHFIKGTIVTAPSDDPIEYRSGPVRFATPRLDLDQVVWSRHEPGPAFDVPLREIIELLVATGERMRDDPDGYLSAAAERNSKSNPLDGGVLRRSYETLWQSFDPQRLHAQLQGELGGVDVVDGWRTAEAPGGRSYAIRAFPPRLVHVLAGNAPGVAAISIARGALTKGVHLLKLPSNDLFTATAVLQTMASVAPAHPTVRSFCAAYWAGGDQTVEETLFRPQFFDKLVAWGGEASIRSAVKYIGPGFELVAFDPKNSISIIGREAFASPSTLADVVGLAATDATIMNQQACVASRFMFIEGDSDDADRFADALLPELGIERPTASAVGPPVPSDVRDEIEALRGFEPDYRVVGQFDGRGVVVRSDEPVDFYPDGKVVNVVAVPTLLDAVAFANVSTQTVGVYPPERKVEIRDRLASAGAQRVVSLGGAGAMPAGASHDGFFPLHRFVRWVNDEG
jgi:Acyl-CoA reductase (LuxC)